MRRGYNRLTEQPNELTEVVSDRYPQTSPQRSKSYPKRVMKRLEGEFATREFVC